jgi:hypothetical protein
VAVVGHCLVGCEHLASCWFFLSSYFAHDARSHEPNDNINRLVLLMQKTYAYCEAETEFQSSM